MSDEANVLTRRDFVRGTVGAAVTASLLGGPLEIEAAPAVKSWVAVVRDEGALNPANQVNEPILRQMLTQVLKAVTDKPDPESAWQALLRKDDIVGLVHTDHLNRTHPELVELVKATLKESGIPEKNIWMVQGDPDKVKECNTLISLPALKAHWLTGIGTVFKNYITFTGSPSSYHDANNAKLGEIWTMPHVKGKTKLVLVDALRPLCDKGPQPDPRYMWQYKGLIAGTDPVAVETVCLKILLEKRQALRGEPWPLSPPPLVVEMADKRYGLGTSNLEEIGINRIGWMDQALV
jgi:Domain of unknown function (DUF362)